MDRSSARDVVFDERDASRWSADQLAKVQVERMRATVQRCLDRHPHYGPRLRRAGLGPADIRAPGDIAKLSLTTKSEFLTAPDAFRLTPGTPVSSGDLLWDVMYTTGSTTGEPAPVYATSADHFAHLAAARREGLFIGLSSVDCIANLLPLTKFPMGAYARSASDAASLDASMIWCHTGRSGDGYYVHHTLDEAIDLVCAHRATVLWGIASFIRRFLLRCAERKVLLPSVRMSLVTGEAVTDGLKAELARLMLQAKSAGHLVINRYGATELGTSLYECAPGSGLHLLTPEDVYFEVVDLASQAAVPDGEVGSLAFTHLHRTGTVLLRYLIGDVTSLSHEQCPSCGRTSPRLLAPPRRTAGSVKIKGTLVDLNGLHEQLANFQEVNEAQILVRREDPKDPYSADTLEIRIVAHSPTRSGLAEAVAALTNKTTMITPIVSVVSDGALFDPLTTPKAQYIVDQR